MKCSQASAALICIILMAVSPASLIAEEERQPDASQMDSSDLSAAPSAASKSRLQGGVKGAALLTEDGLVKLGQATKDLKQATLLLIGEVTRKELVQVRGANVLPNGVVIQPMPMPSGLAEAGPLPPRKRQLKLFMRTIEFDVLLLRNEVDALIIPESKASLVSAPWEQIRSSISKIEEHLAELRLLTAGPKYDSLKIGRQAVAIHDLIDAAEKSRRQVVSLLK
jgi:hypothetical protein